MKVYIQSRTLFLIGLFVLLFGLFNSQAQHLKKTNLLTEEPADSYNPSFKNQALQFGSGVLFGAAGGVVGLLGGVAVAPEADGPAGLAALGYAYTGGYIGYVISSSLGVYKVANTASYNASFGNILVGHVIGAGIGLGSVAVIQDPIALGIAFSTPIIGGMIANSNSIEKRNNKTSALLNISDGNATLSTPLVQLTNVGNYNLPKNQSTTVQLLDISF